jgi:hypothetical protein
MAVLTVACVASALKVKRPNQAKPMMMKTSKARRARSTIKATGSSALAKSKIATR